MSWSRKMSDESLDRYVDASMTQAFFINMDLIPPIQYRTNQSKPYNLGKISEISFILLVFTN